MTDFVWPSDLVPYAQSFYLQSHSGGTESPFSRQTKVYGLSAPRWVCSMAFRGGYNGRHNQEAFGPRLDALIAKLKGRENRVSIYDFRRPVMRGYAWPSTVSNASGAIGATSLGVTGLLSGQTIFAGDYVGGDGRPHLITDDAIADAGGATTINFQPPLKAAIGSGAALFGKAPGWFRLIDDDSGENGVEVGTGINVTLKFVEDLTDV